jgi:AraC-like DNA-binding protein
MESSSRGTRCSRYHQLHRYRGIEFLEASLTTHTFCRHTHAGFAIGAIAEGVGGYHCRGESIVLPAGSLSLMNPEEPHTGYAADGRVRYHMLYAAEEATRELLGLRGLRGFSEIAPIDRDLRLTRALGALARRLDAADSPDWWLAVEEAVYEAITVAFACYGNARLPAPGNEPRSIAALRSRIAAVVEAGEGLTIAEFAAEVGLHPSYLVRSFARATGMTPHALVVQRRVDRARRMLLDGVPAAEVAAAVGFCDQAHLIRQFRRHYGVTPGAMIRHQVDEKSERRAIASKARSVRADPGRP